MDRNEYQFDLGPYIREGIEAINDAVEGHLKDLLYESYLAGWTSFPSDPQSGFDTFIGRLIERLKDTEIITLESGQILRSVHSKTECAEEFCCIHNPSDHSMQNFPRKWRDEGFMERICPHGIGHPDPDDRNAPSVHGCDGCCHG